jgi:hypothetical protein
VNSGSRRIATIPLSGTGQAPFALLQPASSGVGSPSSAAAAVLDENGTLYAFDDAGGGVTATDVSGRSTILPVTNLKSAHGMAIDGAGILYLLPGTPDEALITYDTVQGIQGTVALPASADKIDSIAIGTAGDLYAVSTGARLLYLIHRGGEVTSTSLGFASDGSPTISAVALASGRVAADSALGTVSSLKAPSQVQTQSRGRSYAVLGADAAGTLYANSADGLVELAAPAFTSSLGRLPAALAFGSDGSLVVAGSQGIARLDRTQSEMDFGLVAGSVKAAPQVALLYNAGNQPLALSDIHVDGDGLSLASTPDNPCTGGLVVAPGSSCEIAVALLAPASGAVSGSVSIASDSLNQPVSLNKLRVKAQVAGSQAILTPNSLIFPNTTVNVASAAQTITLSNPGTAALNISSIALTGAASGSYSLTTTCLSSTVTSLAAGASCTISVVFKPLTAASQSATVSVSDDVNGVVGSSQSATLIGLGVAAPAPVISFAAVSANGLSNAVSTTGTALGTLSFGSTSNPVEVVPAGTPTPPSGTVTITNTGNAVLNLSPITLILSGTSTVLPYTQTNNCPATLAVGASCLVTVQFVPPPGVGLTYTAVLVLVDNAANSPQTFGISGISTTDDFTMSASTANLAIPSGGGSGQVVITSTPDPGPFFTPISLSVFGIPAGATYSFSPIAITSVTGPSTSTLTITLPTYKNVILSSLDRSALFGRASLPAAACLLAGLCFGLRRRRIPRLTRVLQLILFGLLGFGAVSMSGCSSGVPISGGVAPGTYYLTVSGTSANGSATTAGASHQVTITLLVK